MTERRWFVTANGEPVDWAQAVVDGLCAQAVYVIIQPSEEHRPWRLLWLPPGHACGPDQLEYAIAAASSDPVPEVRRPLPKPVPPQLSVVRGGR